MLVNVPALVLTSELTGALIRVWASEAPMWTPFAGNGAPNLQVSTKAGQLHDWRPEMDGDALRCETGASIATPDRGAHANPPLSDTL